MASKESGDFVRQRGELRDERKPVSDTWAGPALILAGDRARAATIAAGLGLVPHSVERIDAPSWSAERLRLKVAGLVILASARVDLPLLAKLLAMPRFRAVPVLVFVDESTREETIQALKLGVSAFIVDGLESERVPAIVDVASERHALTQDLQEKLRKSQSDLAARKTIERAKGLIMTKSGLSEQEVYDAMRRLAMAQGKPLREIAETILSVFALFP